MSAPTAAQLLDFNLQVDTALQETFSAALSGLNIPFFTYQMEQEADVPRLEGLFSVGGQHVSRGGTYYMALPSLSQGYVGQFIFNGFTRRTEGELPTPVLGIIRQALNPRTSILNSKLAWLQILTLDEMSSERRVNTEGGDKCDECTIIYTLSFAIKGDYQSILLS